MFLWLNISVVIYIVSWNIYVLFSFFVTLLSWEENWSSIDSLILSINILRNSLNVLVQNSRLSNDLLSDWKFERFIDDFWFSSDFFGQYFWWSCNLFFDNFWFSGDHLFFSLILISKHFFFPSCLINISIGVISIHLSAMSGTDQ